MSERGSTLFEWMVEFVKRNRRAPTAAEIRTACDFSQAGGIARLCATLETFGVLMAKSASGRVRAADGL